MPSATSYAPGDLLLVAFPFSSGSFVKVRPALVVVDTGDSDVVVARVTTQLHQTPHDVRLADWQGAGLLGPSVARLHKLATLEKTLVRRKLGHLRAADKAGIAVAWRRICEQWR